MAHSIVLNDLPPELLIEVFLALVHSLTDSPEYRTAKKPELILSHVCSSWRAAALSSPALWRLVAVTDVTKQEELEHWLVRSRSMPLIVDLKYLSASMKRLMSLLVREAHRWRAFRCQSSCIAEKYCALCHLCSTPIPTSSLLSLTLKVDDTGNHARQHRIFGNAHPVLTDLQLHNVAIPSSWSSANLPALRSVHFEVRVPYLEPSVFCQWLSVCSGVTELILRKSYISPWVITATDGIIDKEHSAATLPKLKHLILDYIPSFLSSAFDLINGPSLEDLELKNVSPSPKIDRCYHLQRMVELEYDLAPWKAIHRLRIKNLICHSTSDWRSFLKCLVNVRRIDFIYSYAGSSYKDCYRGCYPFLEALYGDAQGGGELPCPQLETIDITGVDEDVLEEIMWESRPDVTVVLRE